MKPFVLEGRARIVSDADIDTDMIFHNRHLHITDPAKMGQHIFENLKGREGFAEGTLPGDILIVGHNFGCGSSRQQAVDGLVALGVAAIVGESFGAIYKRNAINAGWPLIEMDKVLECGVAEGEVVRLDLEAGVLSDLSGIVIARGKPMTEVQKDIYMVGGLLNMK